MFSTLTTINGYSPIKALFLKEYWDNKRAILVTPMVATGLFIFFAIVAMINGTGILFDGASMFENISQAQGFEAEAAAKITSVLFVTLMLLVIVTGFSMVFTALSVLFDERKNKSILFWKSMPVSDTQEVLVKLATVTVVTPVVAIGFAFIIQLFAAIVVGSMITINTNLSAWNLIFSNINYLELIAADIIMAFVMILWTLPIITWFMLISSFSRRSPFLLAFIIPILVMVIETIFFRSALLFNAILSRIDFLGEYGRKFELAGGENVTEGVFTLIRSFSEPNFWYGIIVAIAMIAGCIQIRKRSSIA